MKICLQLFYTFFKIGAFTLGGGYAMLPMVEKAVVDKKKWIGNDEFWDMIAIVQSLPGVFAVNTALYVGRRIAGLKGGLAAMLGAILPSFIIILIVATLFKDYKDNTVVERVFKGIRPCVVALILAPSIRMIQSVKLTWWSILLFAAVIALIAWLKVASVYVIAAALVGSMVFAFYNEKKNKEGKP